jgi:very-short-patch-repair endonuclease
MAPAYGHELTRLAMKQHGVVSREQALACGVASTTITRAQHAAALERLYPGVYRLAGAPATWRQSLLAACLAMGDRAVISHAPAGALFQLPGLPPRGVEVSVPRGRRRIRGITFHRPMSLEKVDVTAIDAIPVTTPARTLIDLATCVDRDRLEEALDDALRRRLVSLPKLRWRIKELGARKLLTKLVEERAHGVTESNLEIRVLRAIRAAGLPKPVIQHRIGRYRVDLAYPEDRVAVECDGYQFHSGRRAFDADRERRNVLTAMKWTVLHATWTDVEQLVETLAALIA